MTAELQPTVKPIGTQARAERPIDIAVADIADGLRAYRLAALLGWHDVKLRYRRSTLGPFWLTISMAVMMGALALVFGQIFRTPLTEFLPFLCAGLIVWGFISTMVTEGCLSFISSDYVIKELPLPLFVHVLRTYFRNVLILLHNLVIFPLVLAAFGKALPLTSFFSLFGFILVSLNLLWMSLLTSVLCTRYRDLPPIIINLVQVAFYLTPIIWPPQTLPEQAILIIDLNPFAHIVNVIRAPLLGEMPPALSWVVTGLLAIVGWVITIMFYGRYKRRVAYWL
jgi:ABC-type polysaccharide/polyol phosphate export permease